MLGNATTDNGSALLAAAQWLEGLIYSPATTVVAVLAVAGTGLSMLTGRLGVKRGATVALGCFVLFGAPAIARGIRSSATSFAAPEAAQPIVEPSSLPAFEPPEVRPPASNFDPYAGASVAG